MKSMVRQKVDDVREFLKITYAGAKQKTTYPRSPNLLYRRFSPNKKDLVVKRGSIVSQQPFSHQISFRNSVELPKSDGITMVKRCW